MSKWTITMRVAVAVYAEVEADTAEEAERLAAEVASDTWREEGEEDGVWQVAEVSPCPKCGIPSHNGGQC
jgi:hypothetical protein